jgi:hypothetical protein
MINLYRVITGKTRGSHAARFIARLADFAGATPEHGGQFLRRCCDLSELRKQNGELPIREIWRREVYADDSLHGHGANGDSRKSLDEVLEWKCFTFVLIRTRIEAPLASHHDGR